MAGLVAAFADDESGGFQCGDVLAAHTVGELQGCGCRLGCGMGIGLQKGIDFPGGFGESGIGSADFIRYFIRNFIRNRREFFALMNAQCIKYLKITKTKTFLDGGRKTEDGGRAADAAGRFWFWSHRGYFYFSGCVQPRRQPTEQRAECHACVNTPESRRRKRTKVLNAEQPFGCNWEPQ